MRLNTIAAFACLCVVAQGCAVELADQGDVELETQALDKPRLLALGDSIAFGYNPFGDFTKDKNFAGYPEALKDGYSIKNASCPGETSASLFNPAAPDRGCRSCDRSSPTSETSNRSRPA